MIKIKKNLRKGKRKVSRIFMEKYYLEIPTIERKDEAVDYVNEFLINKSNTNGVGGLDRFLGEGKSYEEWLDFVIKCQEKSYAEQINRVPGITYFTVRESDNKIVGMVNFRFYLKGKLLKIGGHIGYGIRPTERRKGLAKIQLYLTLLAVQKIGLDKVMIDCTDTNICSKKTIEALGGKYSETVIDNEETYLNYWINVNDSIKKYKPIYEEYIKIDKEVK